MATSAKWDFIPVTVPAIPVPPNNYIKEKFFLRKNQTDFRLIIDNKTEILTEAASI